MPFHTHAPGEIHRVSTETARRPRSTAKGAEKKSASTRPSPKTAPKPAPKDHADDDPMKALLAAMIDVRNGDFSVQLPQHWEGLHGKLAEHFNEIVIQNCELSRELARVGQTVGREGQTRRRITLPGAAANGR